MGDTHLLCIEILGGLLFGLICVLVLLAIASWVLREKVKAGITPEIDWKDQTPEYCSSFLDAVLYVADKRGINVNRPFEVKVPPASRGDIYVIGGEENVAVGHITHDRVADSKFEAVPYGVPYHYERVNKP